MSTRSRFEVHALVDLFRQAVIAVGPLAERAGVAWLQEPPYDDWEAIVDGMFNGFVRSAILNSRGLEQLDLPRYGFEPEKRDAFLVADDESAFVRFAGADRTLSQVLFVDAAGRYQTRLWDELNLVLRLPDGSRETHLDVVS